MRQRDRKSDVNECHSLPGTCPTLSAIKAIVPVWPAVSNTAGWGVPFWQVWERGGRIWQRDRCLAGEWRKQAEGEWKRRMKANPTIPTIAPWTTEVIIG